VRGPGYLRDPDRAHRSSVDVASIPKEAVEETPVEKARQELIKNMPSLDQCLNLYDFEVCSRSSLPGKGG
jgi:hypothetical protein